MNESKASLLVRGGFNFLAFDLLYFGERKTGLLTTFTEEDEHQQLYNQPGRYLSWVTQSIRDAGRAFDLLVQTRRPIRSTSGRWDEAAEPNSGS